MTLLLDAPNASRPSHRSVPRARSREAATEAIELAASAGLFLDPWQQNVLSDALGERADGTWAAFEVGLVVPRQNGKGSILEARELAGLFLFGEELILHSAHEFKTAAEAFRRILQLVQSTPDLDRRVMRVRTSHGDEGIELRNGHRLRFVARSTGSGRGFSGDCVILDEAYNLTPASVSALLPTMAARPNPQLWYTSSAPLERAESGVLRKLIKRGRSGASKSLAFMEFCATVNDDPEDERAWAKANPSFPHRISADFILKEFDALELEDFSRERLGIWVDPEDDSDQVIPPADWAASIRPDASIDGRPSFALEVAEDFSWTAFGASGASTADVEVHGEVIEYKAGTDWLIPAAKALHDAWSRPLVVVKGTPAASFVADLKRAGVPVDEISTDEHARRCGRLYDLVVNRQFSHRDQAHLNVALRGAVRRDYGDSWVWSRRRSSIDISPLTAVTASIQPESAPADWDFIVV